MRYVIAATVSTVVIGALLFNHWRVSSFEATVAGLGVEVTSRVMLSIKISHAFRRLWFAILPLVLIICFGIARLAGRSS
jgi:hypothetical protein